MPPVVFSIEKGCLSVGFATEREVYNTAHTHFQTAIRKGRHSGRVTRKKRNPKERWLCVILQICSRKEYGLLIREIVYRVICDFASVSKKHKD